MHEVWVTDEGSFHQEMIAKNLSIIVLIPHSVCSPTIFMSYFFSNALWYLKSSYEYLTYAKSGWSGKSVLWGIQK